MNKHIINPEPMYDEDEKFYEDDDDMEINEESILKEHPSQYIKDDNKFVPLPATVNKLPAGYYKPIYTSYNDKVFAVKKNIASGKLYDLPNGLYKTLTDDITHFWESEARYRQFGNLYKRNILLYSIPGNGKTCLIHQVCEDIINRYEGVVFYIDDQETLEAYPKLMDKVRAIEPNRKIITIIEDFERLIGKEHNSSLLLQILDGSNQYDGVLTIATTNYPEKIGEQFTLRPSRFNLIVEYKKPDENVRRFYITNKLKDAGFDIEKIKDDIERYVQKTEGYTFDYVKEAIEGIYVTEIPEDELFERLNKSISMKGKYTTTERSIGRLGFLNSDD